MIRGDLILRLTGAALLGGHTAPPTEVDAATASFVDPETGTRVPFMPGSAVRGALREAVSRLVTSEGQQQPPPCDIDAPCVGEPCVVCRLFGRAGVDRPGLIEDGAVARGGGWMKRSIRIADARPSKPVPLSTRHGVAIDRRTGHASPGRYFQRQVADTASEVTFVAAWHGDPLPEDLETLTRALPLLDAIGGARSRGLGRVTASLSVHGDADPAPRTSIELASGAAKGRPIVVGLEALEPLHLGGIPDSTSFASTERVVTGAALKGALVAALVRCGLDDSDERFRALVDPAVTHFSDLLPAARSDVVPFALPRTAVRCTDCGRHVEDRILREALAEVLAESRVAVPPPTCPRCESPLRPASGVWPTAEHRRRLVTRLRLDPRSRAYAQGRLYAREQIEAGSRFAGVTRSLVPDALAALQLLRDRKAPIYVGGMRSRGLGACRIVIEPWTEDPLRRLEIFQQTASRQFGSLLEAVGWDPAGLVPVLAASPLDLGHAAEPSAAAGAIGRALFGEAAFEVRGEWVRRGPRSGWDDHVRPGARPVLDVLEAGSCWLFEAASAPRADALLDAETAGLGGHCELGLGRLRVAVEIGR